MIPKKFVFLVDMHVPFNIYLDPVYEFIQDFKPDITILGGDIGEFGPVNHWLADQSKYLDTGIIIEHYAQLKLDVFNPIKKATPKSEKIFLEGNHENWIHLATAQDPNLRGYIELAKNIPSEYKIIPLNRPYRMNENLAVIHGAYTGMYHARQTVEAYMTSILYGHNHTFQTFTKVSPIDNERFYTAMSIGSLCELNPGFMKNRPNAWINGLAYGYLGERNTFSVVSVVIVRNRFHAEGRYYK